ncbi:MAG: response regulator [Oscillospiraceae bacterium]|nr:response regulator [Oscillospiraceae bacterium]
MTYSIIGILATILLLITNRELFWSSERKALTGTQLDYRCFLLGALAYLITDMLWGILESHKLISILYVDTAVHFIAMAAAVMLWTRYVISYLGQENAFGTFLSWTGQLFLCFEAVVVIVNFFRPILFWFDDSGTYYAGIARYVTLTIQILLFFLTSVYTLWITAKTEGSVRHRHLTIGLFGIAMDLCIAVQVFYPLLPFYAMGYMLGTCLLHSFVMEDEKEEYRRGLEEAVAREKLQKAELAESREALQDALTLAEHANRAKTVFLSNMSHEIRTPINAIIGLNNIAMNDPTASDKVKEYLEKIGVSAQHLLGIINDILDMSRIESGCMTIKQEEFSFSKGLEEINTMISGQCRDKGLNYDCQITGQVDEYYIGDIMKLKQVLINILGNAVKFTPAGGEIRLVIEEGPRLDGKATLKFVISDTGIGMSKEYLPHLFEAFSQEDASSTSRYGSTGLGMPITKSIVELMNGHIEVESEKGKGSVFTVTVTLGESERKSIQPNEEDLDPHELNVFVMDEFQEAFRRKNELLEKETTDLKGKRVLLAEDVAVNAEIILMLLSMREMEADLAENGRVAVELFSSHEPGYYNAILMDMRMPEMDGLEAARHIRSMDRADAKSIPIIALTANAFDEDVQRSMQAGLNAHLSKPVVPDSLFETLETLIT